MVTRSGDSVVYMPQATKARSSPGPPRRASPKLLVAAHLLLPWCAGVRPRITGGFRPISLLDGFVERRTRLAQTSWALPGGLVAAMY